MIDFNIIMGSVGELLIILSLPSIISFLLFKTFNSIKLFKYSLILNYIIIITLLINSNIIPIELIELLKLV